MVVAVAVLLLLLVWQWRRTRRLGRRLDALTRGEEGKSLDEVLDAHLDKVFAMAREVDELTVRTAVAEANLRRSFQRVGLVRFNPFEDTGGNQSFALALLDANGDGLVMSSLHSRTGTRVYAKAVSGGKSETALSDEETQAVQQAMTGPAVRPPGAA
ncbi:MAG TPA: DUF4446 family protein [Clostridia bacterium]|nr:DUF4446 family protein [Clostridia bacterium]